MNIYQDYISVKGSIIVEHRRNGKLISRYKTPNTITNAGKAQIAALIGDAAAVPFTYLAVGTATTAPAASQTTLGAEITTLGMGRAAGTITRTTTTVTNDTYQNIVLWTSSGTVTVEEVGVFNAASGGTMLGRALTTSKPLISGDTLTITYKVAFA